jgi:hypothetical protein
VCDRWHAAGALSHRRASATPGGAGRAALDAATEYCNARRGYAACALTDVLHAQFELALARFNAGELDYANEVEDVLRKVPEQRRQISELEDR